MSCAAASSSVSAPSTPTEQVRHGPTTKKKAKHNNRVHFPDDEALVTCFLEPADPWSKVYGNTLDTLLSSYVAACDKQGIKPLTCVLDQLQEIEKSTHKLSSNPRAFDLSILGEKLSMKHCEALEEVLRRLQFHLVDLEGCYLEDEGAAAFFDMIEYYDSATQLNISFTKHIDCRGWQACSRMLKKTTSLVHLNARSTGLNEQVLLIVGRALRLGSNLVTLHLENCGIFGRCLVILVAALKLNTTMRELYLAENKISSADGFQLGNLLRTNTHLELLDLSNNKLGDEGLTHVMDSLGQQSNTSGRGLYTLILWNNDLTAKGMPCISRALTAARALRRLNLGSNSITGAGILELKLSLICNRTIESLELENASITSTGVFALAEYINQNQFIQKLDIRGNDIRLADLVALNQAVEKNPNVVSLLVDPTSMDLTESIKDRQDCLQEINKNCQRNKEAKSTLPPQDEKLSTLFNGIFSHVLPSPVPQDDNDPPSFLPPPPQKTTKGRFRVSVVANPSRENGIVQQPVRSFSLDANCLRMPKTVVSSDGIGSPSSPTSIVGVSPKMVDSPAGGSALAGTGPKTHGTAPKPVNDLNSGVIGTTPNPAAFANRDALGTDNTTLKSAATDDTTSKSAAIPSDGSILVDQTSSAEPKTGSSVDAPNADNNLVTKEDGSGSSDQKDGLVLGRVRWLEGLQQPEPAICFCKTAVSEPALAGLAGDDVFSTEACLQGEKVSLSSEPKLRRSSSPTMSSSQGCRKTHSIKCCKELEGLDLRSTVPLSPTRLRETFDFPDQQVSDVPLSSQMNIKSSHAVYMVH